MELTKWELQSIKRTFVSAKARGSALNISGVPRNMLRDNWSNRMTSDKRPFGVDFHAVCASTSANKAWNRGSNFSLISLSTSLEPETHDVSSGTFDDIQCMMLRTSPPQLPLVLVVIVRGQLIRTEPIRIDRVYLLLDLCNAWIRGWRHVLALSPLEWCCLQ